MKFGPTRYGFIPGMVFAGLAAVIDGTGKSMKTGNTRVLEPGWIIRHDGPVLLG